MSKENERERNMQYLTSNCHLRKPSTPHSTFPVWIPIRISTLNPVASRTHLFNEKKNRSNEQKIHLHKWYHIAIIVKRDPNEHQTLISHSNEVNRTKWWTIFDRACVSVFHGKCFFFHSKVIRSRWCSSVCSSLFKNGWNDAMQMIVRERIELHNKMNAIGYFSVIMPQTSVWFIQRGVCHD